MISFHSYRSFAVLGLLFAIGSCIKPPDYSDTPAIEFISIDKESVIEGSDSVFIRFSFTDGDGDLGPVNDQDSTINLFLVDSRDESTKPYQLPNLTPGGNIKAISGEVTVKVEGFSCQAGATEDELTYTIYVEDRAGHKSNQITTTPLLIDCQ